MLHRWSLRHSHFSHVDNILRARGCLTPQVISSLVMAVTGKVPHISLKKQTESISPSHGGHRIHWLITSLLEFEPLDDGETTTLSSWLKMFSRGLCLPNGSSERRTFIMALRQVCGKVPCWCCCRAERNVLMLVRIIAHNHLSEWL